MKKTFFILALIASAFFANDVFSQGSDILTPPVGVGISYPYGDLHVHGTTWHEIGEEPSTDNRDFVGGNAGFTGGVSITGDTTSGGSVSAVGLTASGNMTVAGSAAIGSGFLCSSVGQVKAKEVVVTLEGWSDYVFENGYELMPLGELERYVNANRHLPNIPSASRVLDEGVNVGEMNALLLEKIEELTLYIIDLQKQIDKLKKQMP